MVLMGINKESIISGKNSTIGIDLFKKHSIEEKVIKNSKEREQPRIERPIRNQVEIGMSTLDDKVPFNHSVREIWNFVQELDDNLLNGDVKSKLGHVGRIAKDRRILFTLWLYAYSEGIGSGRHIAKLSKRDDIYRWIVGGVNINYHTIDDFRSQNGEKLDKLFIQCLAVIMKDLNIKVTRIGNDGTKIRAKAKRDSFKKEAKIESYLSAANDHFVEVKKQNEKNEDLSKRKKAARLRHAAGKVERCEKALKNLKKLQKNKSIKEKEKVQVSITEPESRVMKFGGSSAFHPAYNIQCAEDLDTNIIIAVEPTDEHNDSNGLPNVMPTVEKNLGEFPEKCATDKGYSNYNQLDYMDNLGVELYVPEVPDKSFNSKSNSGYLKSNSKIDKNEKTIICPQKHTFDLNERKASSEGSLELRFPRQKNICNNCSLDNECFPEKDGKKKKEICNTIPTERHYQILNKLEERLSHPDAEEILRLRFSSELVHAKIKTTFGLTQFNVQTIIKVRAELLLVAIVHNLKRWFALKKAS